MAASRKVTRRQVDDDRHGGLDLVSGAPDDAVHVGDGGKSNSPDARTSAVCSDVRVASSDHPGTGSRSWRWRGGTGDPVHLADKSRGGQASCDASVLRPRDQLAKPTVLRKLSRFGDLRQAKSLILHETRVSA